MVGPGLRKVPPGRLGSLTGPLMLETRIAATSGMVLVVSSILLGPQFWGYQAGVLILQTGILALGLGLFLRINPRPRMIDPLHLLDDIEFC